MSTVIESTLSPVTTGYLVIPSGGSKLLVASGLSAGEEIAVKVACGSDLPNAINPDGSVVKLTYEIPMALLWGQASYVVVKPETDLLCRVSLGS
jgi:hypothetical protein